MILIIYFLYNYNNLNKIKLSKFINLYISIFNKYLNYYNNYFKISNIILK